jgi:hypothetical protein
MSPTYKRYSFMITEDLAEGLKAVKDEDGTTESETIRRALREFFERRRASAKKHLTAIHKDRRPRQSRLDQEERLFKKRLPKSSGEVG